MAIIEISNQYKYTGKGPVDSKQLVKKYSDLTNKDFWLTESGSNTAYNGMIVSVWMNNEDTEKNGIYYLFDPACTNTLKNPDVTNDLNWHKLGENNLSEDDIQTLINNLIKELDTSYETSDNALKALLDNINTQGDALSALIADDKNKSVRDITKDEIASQIEDESSDLGELVSRIDDVEEAIQGIVSTEEIEGLISLAVSQLDASNIITNDPSYEIGYNENNKKELIINSVNISKLHQDVEFILHGGSASTGKFN